MVKERADYTTHGGISRTNRLRLETLHRGADGPFTVAHGARLLRLEPDETRRLLSQLAARGWLARIRRGLYITVPLEASNPGSWRADPWLVAAQVFRPGYIAGWTACEHWGLTEQIFRSVVVVTAAEVRKRELDIQETPFRIKTVSAERLFGLDDVWRSGVKVRISDPARTMVDLLDDPRLGGGMRHVADVLAAYFESDLRNDEKLLSYVRRLGNRTVYKRLGYLIEALGIDSANIAAVCRERISPGYSLLDPAVRAKGRIMRRWNLRINVTVDRDRRPT